MFFLNKQCLINNVLMFFNVLINNVYWKNQIINKKFTILGLIDEIFF